MLIKSMKINNFRQFVNEYIEFSTDEDKNVTVIHGENGSGKTTLLQAFNWCFYGESNVELSHAKTMMLNKFVSMDLRNGQNEEIKITISFIHSKIEYQFTRIQKVEKRNKELKYYKSSINAEYRDKNGVWKYIEDKIPQNFIESIFPVTLSSYFLFDGERIKNLGDNTRIGKKDLKSAVSKVLNLDNLYNASKHLKIVKDKIREEYSNDYMQGDYSEDIIKNIKRIEEEIDKNKEEKKNIENTIEMYEEYLKENSQKIMSFAEVKAKEEQRIKLTDDIKREESYKDKSYNSFMKKFNDTSFALFATKLFDESMKYLREFQLEDGIIEGIDAKAIDQILDKMVCLCGFKITEGCEVQKKLIALKKYLPPQSYGSMVNNFITQIENIKTKSENIVSDLIEEHKLYVKHEDTIDRKKNEIHELNDFMSSHSLEAVKETEKKSNYYKNEINKLNKRLGNIEISNQQLEIEKKEKNSEKDRFLLDNEKNILVNKRELAVEELMNYFNDFLAEQEIKVREHIQILVSEIFSKVMHKEYFISFNEKYDFSVKDIKGLEVPMSEGEKQVTSISFITGIVNMAKDKELNERFAEKTNYNAAETYPVIMDSPFGSLDNIHRKNIAIIVPKLSNQVILFASSSQWQGEVEKAMKNKIGKEYTLEYIKSAQGDYVEESTRILEEAIYV